MKVPASEIAMWNRKKEEEPPPRPAYQPTSPQQQQAAIPAQGASMSSPVFRPEPEPARSQATIGKNVTITGQIYSREDLFVDGEVEGSIELAESKLTIGPNGKVKAGVHAREVIIIGAVEGNVEAVEKVDIRKDGRLKGDIKTSRIVIEDGAVFKGAIDIVKSEPKSAPAAPKPQAAAAAVAATPPQEVKR